MNCLRVSVSIVCVREVSSISMLRTNTILNVKLSNAHGAAQLPLHLHALMSPTSMASSTLLLVYDFYHDADQPKCLGYCDGDFVLTASLTDSGKWEWGPLAWSVANVWWQTECVA